MEKSTKSYFFLHLIVSIIATSIASSKSIDNNHNRTGYKKFVSRVFNNILTPPNDRRSYRGVKLFNGMKIMLISYPKAILSAASMSVGVGNMNDPWELQGLAHFLEHMVFAGTEKYPDGSEYISFISKHAGDGLLATTTYDTTAFQFYINSDFLKDALDRFAQFFISPLFNDDAIERELNAVHSEHLAGMGNDALRRTLLIQTHFLQNQLLSRRHDISKYSCGSLETLKNSSKLLGLNLRDELIKFHQKFYSANTMTLSVYGKETLDQLEEQVVGLFSKVVNRNVVKHVWNENPFSGPLFTGNRIEYSPIKDTKELLIVFGMPYYSGNQNYLNRYISTLLFRDGGGSLLEVLKRNQWVSGFSGEYQKNLARGIGKLEMTFHLTDGGVEKVDEILLWLFKDINLIKKTKPEQWRLDELSRELYNEFNNQENIDALTLVKGISNLLNENDNFDHVLSDICEIFPTINESISQLDHFLSHLNAYNFNYVITLKQFEGKTSFTDKNTGAQFNVKRIPGKFLEKLENAELSDLLTLPPKQKQNPYSIDIPVSIKPNGSEETEQPIPKIVFQDDFSRLWYAKDVRFFKQEIVASFVIRLPELITVRDVMLQTFFLSTLEKDQGGKFSLVNEAGYSAKLNQDSNFISLQIQGPPTFINDFVFNFTKFLLDFDVDQEENSGMPFEMCFQKTFESDSVQIALAFSDSLLGSSMEISENIACNEKNVTFEEIQKFASVRFEQSRVEALIFGSVDEKTALSIFKNFTDLLNQKTKATQIDKSFIEPTRSILMHEGSNFAYHFQLPPTNFNEGTFFTIYQSNPANQVQKYASIILGQIIQSYCYEVLRAQEQLGYSVKCSAEVSETMTSFRIIVKGPYDTLYVEDRIENMLSRLKNVIKNNRYNITQTAFALAENRKSPPSKFQEQNDRFWDEIKKELYQFDRSKQEYSLLMSVTEDDVMEYIDDILDPRSFKRSKLAIHIHASVPPTRKNAFSRSKKFLAIKQAKNITNINDFKRSMFLGRTEKKNLDYDW